MQRFSRATRPDTARRFHVLRNAVESLEERRLLAVYFVNFTAGPTGQPANGPIVDVPGYITDIGTAYGERSDRGQAGREYGWITADGAALPQNYEANARNRGDARSPDERYDSFNHLQKDPAGHWEIKVPNGTYAVRIVSGDTPNVDSYHILLAEGVKVVDVDTRALSAPVYAEGTATGVNVADEKLTVSFGAGAVNSKMAFIEIADAAPVGAAPTVTATKQGINSIKVDWQYTPNATRDESGYLVERSTDGTNWTVVRTLTPLDLTAAANRTFTDTGLSPDTTYQYRVSAFNPAGKKTSAVASAKTDAVAPGTITGTITPATGLTNLTTEGNLDWVHWGYDNNPAGINAHTIGGSAPGAAILQGSNDYLIWEAEDNVTITDDNADGDVWKVIDNTTTPTADGATSQASNGRALYQDGSPNMQPANDSIAAWRVMITTPGTYRLYYRNRVFDRDGGGLSNNDSVYVAPDGPLDAAPSITDARSNAEYDWRNTGRAYTVATPGNYTFKMGLREGGYIIDRIALSTNTAYSSTQLNALSNSPVDLPTRGGEGPITNFTVIGSATPTATSLPAKTFSWTDGGPVQTVNGTDDAVSLSGNGNGFRFSAPAIGSNRKLRVYVDADNAKGVLKARFVHGNSSSQETVIGELDATGQGQRTGVFEITFSSPVPGGKLEVDYTSASGTGSISLAGATWVEFLAPPVATNLVATPTGTGRIALSWTDVAQNENNYFVQRAPDNAGTPGTFTTIATLPANSRAYVDSGLANSTKYHYRIVATNLVNANDPNPAATPAVSATTGVNPAPLLVGLSGRYFDYGGTPVANQTNPQFINFTGPGFARVDDGTQTDGGTHAGPIDFNWGNNAPGSGANGQTLPGGAENWSTRWEGKIIPDFTALHNFYTDSDDGVRVYLDINQNGTFDPNELIINNFVDQGLNPSDLDGSNETGIGQADWRGGIPLTAGQQYNIRVEHYEQGGGAGMRLFWSNEFLPTPSIVPSGSTLTTPPDVTPPRVVRIAVDSKLPAGMPYTPLFHIAIVFSEDIANSLAPDDLLILGNAGGYGGASLNIHGYDPATNTVVITFPGAPDGVLQDANWQALIYDNTVSDASGNVLDGDNDPNTAGGQFVGDFYVWQGDTQLDFYGNPKPDRIVDFIDYQRLGANFGKPNPSHADGDFDHDGDVDNADFMILRSRFGTGQPPPAAPVSAPAPAPAPVKATPVRSAPVKKPAAKPVVLPVKAAAPARFSTKKIAGVKELLA
jgi:hypothetical protein